MKVCGKKDVYVPECSDCEQLEERVEAVEECCTENTEALATKVDKEEGKGLSTNDFTNAYQTKLEGIEAGAQVNTQANWSQTDSTADDYIKNKPTIPSTPSDIGAQPLLVSGTNIKTINGESVLGSGDIDVSGGGLDSNLFKVTTSTMFESSEIAAKGHTYSEIGVANTSQETIYPIGIVGWNSPDSPYFVPSRIRLTSRALNNTTVSYDVQNVDNTNAHTGKFTVDILWIKVAN